MTFKEIEKIKRLLSTIDSIDDFRKMQELESEVTAFFGDKFNVRLKITTLNTKEFYTKEHENTDKIAVRSFLESLIAQDINAPEIINILDLIEEGECSKNDKTLQQKYISKVFYSYSDRIKFDKMTEAIATAPQEVLNFNMYQVSEVMIDGIITKLKSYASALCTPKRSIQTSAAPIQNNQEINFQPHISIETQNDTVITIEAVFNNARQQIEDAGLPDAQIQDLYDKLSQLEEISKSKESKGKRWAKAKDIMKWLVEQGIAAAGIIIPVLSEVIK